MITLADGRIYMGGLYEARVESDVDPSYQNKIRVRVFAIHDDNTPANQLPYARSCQNVWGNGSGEKKRPNVGVIGWVMFEKGDADHPVWMGCPDEPGNPISETRENRIDGDDILDIKKDRETNIDQDDTLVVHGDQETQVKKQAKHEYGDLSVIVIDGVVYEYGRLQQTVQGDAQTTISGTDIYEVLGHRKLTVAESLELSIGGSERRFIVGQCVIKATNAEGLTTDQAMLFDAVNGQLKALASNAAGIEGASLLLDPLGISSKLHSTGTLTVSAGAVVNVDAPAVRLGPTAQAVVPVCTLPHTHLVFGIPTAPATPGPGTPTSVLAPAA